MDLAKIRKKAKKGKEKGKITEPRKDEDLISTRVADEDAKDITALAEPSIPEEEAIPQTRVEAEESITTSSFKATEEDNAGSLQTTAQPTKEIPEPTANEEIPSEREMDEAQKDKAEGTLRLLLFILGRERYAIVLSDIQMIIETRQCTPIPGTPTFIEGIITQRGSIVCVINLNTRLKLKKRKSESQKIIIIERDKTLFGLLVDAIDVVLEIPMNAFEAAPEAFVEIEEEFVEGVFHHKEKAVARLNLDAVLNFEV